MSAALTRLEEWQARRNGTAPQPAPGIEGEPPTAPVPPTKGRGRRGTTSGSPRGTSGQDNYLDRLGPDDVADMARLALSLRHAITAADKTPAEVAKTCGYWRLPSICRLDLHQMRRVRLSTLRRIGEAAGIASNVITDMASNAPLAIAPEEDAK
jgi:hypothetical protein